MAIDVIVVGGGIAGLSCAWRLQSRGRGVLVLEEKARAGGNVRTEEAEGYRMEYGPHTFMASARDIFTLAEETGLGSEIVGTRPEADKRFIVRHGRLHAIPTGPWSVLTSRLLSFKGKLKLAREPFHTQRGDPSDTAQQFFERRFGPEAANVLAGAFISGVYAGDPGSLSARAAFPLFWRFEQESGGMIRGAIRLSRERKAERKARGEKGPGRKGLFSFRLGLGQLSAGVAAKLGDRMRTGSAVSSISRENGLFVARTESGEFRAPELVLAVPPVEAGGLLGTLDVELGNLLNSIPMAPMTVVHMGHAMRAAQVPDGFGFLAPRGEGVRSLGVLFPSRLFEGRAFNGGDLLTGYIGGVLDPHALELDDNVLLDVVTGDLESLTGLAKRPDFVRIHRVERAIPQFTLGHMERMETIHERLGRIPGLVLAGNYLNGVGLKDAVASGFEAAERLGTGGRAERISS
ncbi:MAG: protoporphyrinogen oxidase [Nanoarchaeota archaeon]|nr:protoporphyrinogen oxidase [Nanoarchaeota archaeon]